MPYSNLPKRLWKRMETCVEKVMKEGHDKESAIAICHSSIMGRKKEFIEPILEEVLPVPGAKEMSLDDRLHQVRAAIEKALNPPPQNPEPYAWVEYVYETYVIVRAGEDRYRIDYTRDAEGNVLAGEMQPVEIDWKPAQKDVLYAGTKEKDAIWATGGNPGSSLVVAKQAPGLESLDLKVRADPHTMKRFMRFLAMLHHTQAGHTGMFAMSVDGDGSETFQVDGLDTKALLEGYDKISGADIEVAREDGFSSLKADRSRAKEYSSAALSVPTSKESGTHTGAMIAFMVPDEAARRLAFPAGVGETEPQPVGDMHLTLCYLGDTAEIPAGKGQVARVLEAFVARHLPVFGLVNGIARFGGDEGGGSNALVALFDSPELPAFRQELVEALEAAGVPYAQEHGFTPHITLATVPAGESVGVPGVPTDPVLFDQVVLVWGDERTSFPLAYPDSPEAVPHLMVYKEAGGDYRWIMLSSNAFRDRDGEIVSQKALAGDVARADQDKNYGPLRWWHVGDPDPVARSAGPGLDIGDCDFNAMHGKILIESGTFRSKAVAEAVAEQAGALQGSILFFHPRSEPDPDGVFHHIHRAERSLLPRGRASNPLVSLFVSKKESDMEISTDKIKEFVALLKGDKKKVKEALQKAELTEKEAEALGITSKELEDAPAGDPAQPAGDPPGGDPPLEPSFVGDLSPEQFTELMAGALSRAVEPYSREVKELGQAVKELQGAVTLKDDTQAALKDAAENLATQVKGLADRVGELEGETPRAVAGKGYRASQDKETIVGDGSTVKGREPGPDPKFFDFVAGK